jgi:hypothetical protein
MCYRIEQLAQQEDGGAHGVDRFLGFQGWSIHLFRAVLLKALP